MYKKILLTLAILALPGLSWAANFSDPVNGIFKGVYGNTISVEIPSLVSKSPVTGDQSGVVSFQLNDSTAYVNFSQLSDLQNGESIQIQYYEDTTNRTKGLIATSIAKFEVPAVVTTTDVSGPQTPMPNQTTTTTTTTSVTTPQ